MISMEAVPSSSHSSPDGMGCEKCESDQLILRRGLSFFRMSMVAMFQLLTIDERGANL